MLDHILSVRDGGRSTFENLTTACVTCNQGKGRKSFPFVPPVPDSDFWGDDSDEMRATFENAMNKWHDRTYQLVCDTKESLYGVGVNVTTAELTCVQVLIDEFGASRVLIKEWMIYAHSRGTPEAYLMTYVWHCGMAHNQFVQNPQAHVPVQCGGAP